MHALICKAGISDIALQVADDLFVAVFAPRRAICTQTGYFA